MSGLDPRIPLEGYDVMEVLPLPDRADRTAMARTLEQALREFDSDGTVGARAFILRAKPKERPSTDLRRYGELLLRSGETALAKNIFATILKSGEELDFAHFGMGVCLEAEGNLVAAESAYRESIVFRPSIASFQKLAALLIRSSKDTDAAQVIERALALRDIHDALRSQLHQSASGCWSRARDWDRSIVHLKKALEIEAGSDEILCSMGAVHLQRGDVAAAVAAFKDALLKNRDNAKAYSGMGCCFVAANRSKGAYDYFARALELDIKNPTAVFYLVKYAYELKRFESAERLATEYLKIAPVNANLLYSVAGLKFHVGKRAEAREMALKALEIQPGHEAARELVAKLGS